MKGCTLDFTQLTDIKETGISYFSVKICNVENSLEKLSQKLNYIILLKIYMNNKSKVLIDTVEEIYKREERSKHWGS